MRIQILWSSGGKICLVALWMMIVSHSAAQSTIKGPTCIIPGTTYQYLINGKWVSSAVMSVCITGGKLTNGKTCSPTGTIPNMILVLWDSSANERKIEVSYGSGKDSLIVVGTTLLNGGAIEDSDRLQLFVQGKSVSTIHCSEATGGSCTPIYTYQWQVSQNGLNWTNIDGATNKDLQYTGKITVSTYFRRITTESRSNTIAYSDWGSLTLYSSN
ncbi:MAG TPA: hypothetical protein VFP87_02990 [Chitinophagaceae bacterium]|nr:hypothetical protein [Chitinophagaceae bacterium]